MMKRNDAKVVVTVVVLCDSDETAAHVERESKGLDGGGAAWLWADTDKVQEHHLDAAESAGVFG